MQQEHQRKSSYSEEWLREEAWGRIAQRHWDRQGGGRKLHTLEVDESSQVTRSAWTRGSSGGFRKGG